MEIIITQDLLDSLYDLGLLLEDDETEQLLKIKLHEGGSWSVIVRVFGTTSDKDEIHERHTILDEYGQQRVLDYVI